MPRSTTKSQIGAEKKDERDKVTQIRTSLKGKTIKTLSANERDELLVLLCLILGLTEKNGRIK